MIDLFETVMWTLITSSLPLSFCLRALEDVRQYQEHKLLDSDYLGESIRHTPDRSAHAQLFR